MRNMQVESQRNFQLSPKLSINIRDVLPSQVELFPALHLPRTQLPRSTPLAVTNTNQSINQQLVTARSSISTTIGRTSICILDFHLYNYNGDPIEGPPETLLKSGGSRGALNQTPSYREAQVFLSCTSYRCRNVSLLSNASSSGRIGYFMSKISDIFGIQNKILVFK